MHCSRCDEYHEVLWVDDFNKLVCKGCRRGEHACYLCKRTFKNVNKGCVLYSALCAGWCCWDCFLGKDAKVVVEEDLNEPLQMCTVGFEEVYSEI